MYEEVTPADLSDCSPQLAGLWALPSLAQCQQELQSVVHLPEAAEENLEISLPILKKVRLPAGEYEVKFHTSIWSFQTLTSAKAAPLPVCCDWFIGF